MSEKTKLQDLLAFYVGDSEIPESVVVIRRHQSTESLRYLLGSYLASRFIMGVGDTDVHRPRPDVVLRAIVPPTLGEFATKFGVDPALPAEEIVRRIAASNKTNIIEVNLIGED